MHTYRNVNCILVQLKMVSTCFRKPIMCSTLSQRSFRDCFPLLVRLTMAISQHFKDRSSSSSSTPLFSRWLTMPCPLTLASWSVSSGCLNTTSSAHHLCWLLCLPVCLLDPRLQALTKLHASFWVWFWPITLISTVLKVYLTHVSGSNRLYYGP